MCLWCMCTGTSTMYIYMYMENTSWRMQYGTQQHMSYHSYVIQMTLHYNWKFVAFTCKL